MHGYKIYSGTSYNQDKVYWTNFWPLTSSVSLTFEVPTLSAMYKTYSSHHGEHSYFKSLICMSKLHSEHGLLHSTFNIKVWPWLWASGLNVASDSVSTQFLTKPKIIYIYTRDVTLHQLYQLQLQQNYSYLE